MSDSHFDFGARRGWLYALLGFDLACAAYFFAWATTPALRPYRFWVMAFDLSFPEFVQYGKAVATAYLLFVAGRRLGNRLLVALAVVFSYLALDDSLGLHERIGGLRIGPALFGSGPEAYHEGQVVYAALFLAVLVPAFAWLARGTAWEQRRPALYFLGTIALLGFAAVVVDFSADFIPNPRLQGLVGIGEELGEHLALTLALWLALVLKSPREQALHSR